MMMAARLGVPGAKFGYGPRWPWRRLDILLSA